MSYGHHKILSYQVFTDYANFITDFPENPVLEHTMHDKNFAGASGSYVHLVTMHQDIEHPFVVELPWSVEIQQYIEKNSV